VSTSSGHSWEWRDGGWTRAPGAGAPNAPERDAASRVPVEMIEVEIRCDAGFQRSPSELRVLPPPGKVMVSLALIAVLDGGDRVEVEKWGFSERPPAQLGVIREVVDIGLGRLSAPHPTPLAWAPLVDALASSGIAVSESQLQTLPVRLRVAESAEALVEMD